MAMARSATEIALEDILKLDRDGVVELFRQLEAPDFEELNGEYTGLVPDGGDAETRARVDKMMFDEHSPFGYWLGKAYQVTGPNTGEGYNHCRRPDGRVDRFLRFGTCIGPSQVDGRPSLVMRYGDFNNGAGKNDLVDEIRKVRDGVYLGLGSRRAEDGSRTPPGPFVMTGPIASWVGVDDEAKEILG